MAIVAKQPPGAVTARRGRWGSLGPRVKDIKNDNKEKNGLYTAFTPVHKYATSLKLSCIFLIGQISLESQTIRLARR